MTSAPLTSIRLRPSRLRASRAWEAVARTSTRRTTPSPPITPPKPSHPLNLPLSAVDLSNRLYQPQLSSTPSAATAASPLVPWLRMYVPSRKLRSLRMPSPPVQCSKLPRYGDNRYVRRLLAVQVGRTTTTTICRIAKCRGRSGSPDGNLAGTATVMNRSQARCRTMLRAGAHSSACVPGNAGLRSLSRRLRMNLRRHRARRASRSSLFAPSSRRARLRPALDDPPLHLPTTPFHDILSVLNLLLSSILPSWLSLLSMLLAFYHGLDSQDIRCASISLAFDLWCSLHAIVFL